MAVEVGSAVGYLDLDISGFLEGFKTAQSEASHASDNIAKQVGDKFKGVGKTLTSAGKTLTTTVTTPIIGLGTTVVKTSADFESSMSKVSAISGATGDELDALNKKAQEMGAKTKFSAKESADAFTYMAMAGWKTEDMLSGIDGIMALAAADGLDLATTSDIVTDALTAFGMSADESSHFADVLAKASSSANTNVSMLGESFKYVAPVAGSLGYSAEDAAIALGLMANAGIKGSQGGTALRASLTRLIKPTDEAAALMEEYNISLTNSDGTMKSLGEVMDSLRSNLGGLTEAEQAHVAAELFGQEAMSGMLAIVNTSDDDYQNLTNSIYNCEGAAQQMADVQLDNLSGQLTLLKSALEGVAIQLGEIVVPYVKDFVSKIQGLVQKFSELDPKQQEFIVKAALIAAAIGPILLVVGKLTSGIGSLITGFGKITSLFGGFGSAASAAAGPAQAAAGGVGGLAKSALNLLAAGAGIMLAATGLALLAQSAIALADAGWPAIAVLGGLVAAIAGLAIGAAALGPALTAGSVGLVAFGGAVALIGVGILAATAGVTLLATQLPTIAEYGGQAAAALAELGAGLVAFAAGALVASGGLTAMGAGLTVVAVGAAAAAVGVTALGAGVIVVAAGALALGVALVTCGAGLAIIAATGSTAASGMERLGIAATAAFVPIVAGAASCAALDIAVAAGLVTLGLFTVELGASAVACGLLAAAMKATAVSVSEIESSAKSAADSLSDMVNSVSVVKSGIEGLKSIASEAIDGFISVFKSAGPTVSSEAAVMANGITNSLKSALELIPTDTTITMTKMNSAVMQGINKTNATVAVGMILFVQTITAGMNQVVSVVTSEMSSVVSIVQSNRSSIASSLSSLSGSAHGWGADFVASFANGITSRMSSLLSTVQTMASSIRSYLHFSEPDIGPLSDFHTWMPDFMEGLAKGIRENSYRVEGAVDDLAEDMKLEPKSSPVSELFTDEDISHVESYNIVLLDTLDIYKQLVEQMQMYSEYSAFTSPIDNGLMRSTKAEVDAIAKVDEKSDKDDNSKKPDQLVIPINIGDEQLETVVVDLLKREVRT